MRFKGSQLKTSTYGFAVSIVMALNIAINKTFGIHDAVKHYSCYNVFNERNQYVQCFNMHTSKYG